VHAAKFKMLFKLLSLYADLFKFFVFFSNFLGLKSTTKSRSPWTWPTRPFCAPSKRKNNKPNLVRYYYMLGFFLYSCLLYVAKKNIKKQC